MNVKREFRPAKLECDNGHSFEASILHVGIVPDETSEPPSWVPETGSASGVICPTCDSELVRLKG